MDEKFDEIYYKNDDFISIEKLNVQGDDVQKLSVIESIPHLMQVDAQQTYARVIPRILQELPNASCEFHVMASKVFKTLIERQVPMNLLHTVLQGVESRDSIVANAWMETLICSIEYLSEVQIKSNVIPLANVKSLLSQPISARIFCAKMLGKIAVHKSLDENDVKRDVLPLAQSLCQDCHPDVRTVICLQLSSIAKGLGTLFMKSNLLASLVELASDENMHVRSASVSMIVEIFPYANIDIKKMTMLPLIKQLCEKSIKQEDITSAIIAKEIGNIVNGLQLSLCMNDSIWFLTYYKKLAHRGLGNEGEESKMYNSQQNVSCREYAASNLPAMSQFTFAIMPGQIDLLYVIFRNLAADPCYLVRRTVSEVIHEVIKIFSLHSKMLKPDLVRLLRDDSEDVLQALVPNLGTSLELFAQFRILSRQISNASTLDIGRAMLKCQLELSEGNNWRLLTNFIRQLEQLPSCMPSDFIHLHFTPVILSCAVQGRAKPVRFQAARTLLVFLRYNCKEMQRQWLRESLITQLCRSKNCYTRHIYISLCVNAMDIFSDKYFKSYFFESLLELSGDPVANIRLCIASLFSVLKHMLVLPEDKVLSDKLTDTFRKYSREETDRDVIQIFQAKMKEIKSSRGTNKEEYETEQKRRLQEELEIDAGGKTLFQSIPRRAQTKSEARQTLVRSSSSFDYTSKINLHRSSSVPPKPPNTQTSSDMNFLEQHFYIDAGVNLPIKPINVKKTTNNLVSNLPKQNHSDNYTMNITDDDKVNLRKLSLSAKVNQELKNKRHSSVLPLSCLEANKEVKAINRRSLNLATKDVSKIPVSKSSQLKKVVFDEKIKQNDARMPSYLPVLVRRTHSEARK